MTVAVFVLAIAFSFMSSSCTNLPKSINSSDGLKPGYTLFEAAFIKGAPNWYGSMNGELAVGFPDDSVWLIRNGYLSHQLGSGNYALKVDSIKAKAPAAKSYFISIPKNREQDLFWLLGVRLRCDDQRVICRDSHSTDLGPVVGA